MSQKRQTVSHAQALAAGGQTKPPGAGRRERRAAETRLRLFRCALQLIAERGFPNVTVEDITEAADVGKGTFFNYFATKDHVLGVMAEIQLSKVRQAASLASQGKQAIHTVLHQLMLRLAEEPGRSPDLARALISSFLASERVRKIIVDRMLEGHKMIAEVVAAGQKRGEIDPRLHQKKVATQLLQAEMGTILLWSTHGEPALKVWIEDSFEHFWRAIALSGQEKKP
ncbi:MAG TPA: TetR/AcrR family transcriptional regulator [Terracidiphilus sp.]|nr:TetR/AcrR family transcriptional regulator [Terracidiphilus sp.]